MTSLHLPLTIAAQGRELPALKVPALWVPQLALFGGFGSGLLPQHFVTPYLPRNPPFVSTVMSVGGFGPWPTSFLGPGF